MTGLPAPCVSVITAADSARSRFLADAYESLAGQVLPPGRSWEWCLQLDGPGPGAFRVPEDHRVSSRAHGGRAGAAASRNLALARARGAFVVTLDADDVLLPGALATVLDLFDRDPGAGWVATGHARMAPDGSLGPPEPLRIGTRTVPAGGLPSWWEEFGHVPLIPHCVAYRATAARAAGGWMALPRSEDTGLMMTVAHHWPGRTRDVATLGYRHWPDQQTAEPWITDGSYAKAAGRLLIEQRLEALARTRP